LGIERGHDSKPRRPGPIIPRGQPRRLSARQMREYRAGRDRAVAEFAEMVGVRALVID